ncbi:NRT1 [Auxenochlorella protothecoides x Auxenochlorella symbiontica]|uniref:Uncharacterized protein n=1 Tax=Auxenochlorella protothecoides TaxID=3075 RepID=A0A1D2AG98_AUXPR
MASQSPSRLSQAGQPGDEPPRKHRSTLLTVCPFILGNEFCERLAYYGLSTNLILYLTRVMGEESGHAALQVSLFSGTCYLTPLLGAWLADSMWGRYKTIMVFSLIYFLGMLLLATTALVPALTPPPDLYPTRLQNAALFTSLYIVALGTGGIKPNVSAFGADQFDMADPQDRKEKTSFFNWFYFFVNIGSFIAVTVIVWVQENVNWGVGFAIPAACMGLAILVFVAGSPMYTHVVPTESPITRVYNVVMSAWREKRRGGNVSPDEYAEDGPDLSSPLLGNGAAHSLLTGAIGGRKAPGGAGAPPLHPVQSFAWLDAATRTRVSPGGVARFTRRQVEEVKLVLRMLPIFVTTILYWTVYMQMGSFFVVQGASMNRTMPLPGGGTFTIPAASLAIVNTLGIVLLIPLYDRVVIPLLRRAGRPMTLLRRIGWGMVVCAGAMFAAASLEAWRLRLYAAHDVLPAAGANDWGRVVNLSVWWQAPQYLLVGLSEVFTSIGQLEFFYDQAPDVMRSCSMALQLLSVCIGSYLSGGLIYFADIITRRLDPEGYGWLPKNLNKGRLDLFLLCLGGIMTLNCIIFWRVAVKYEYKTVEHVQRVTVRERPPRPVPGPRPPSAPLASPGTSAAHQILPRLPRESPAPALYGRSVTFMPPSPVMPAVRR